jgi:hypothetical protein
LATRNTPVYVQAFGLAMLFAALIVAIIRRLDGRRRQTVLVAAALCIGVSAGLTQRASEVVADMTQTDKRTRQTVEAAVTAGLLARVPVTSRIYASPPKSWFTVELIYLRSHRRLPHAVKERWMIAQLPADWQKAAEGPNPWVVRLDPDYVIAGPLHPSLGRVRLFARHSGRRAVWHVTVNDAKPHSFLITSASDEDRLLTLPANTDPLKVSVREEAK